MTVFNNLFGFFSGVLILGCWVGGIGGCWMGVVGGAGAAGWGGGWAVDME